MGQEQRPPNADRGTRRRGPTWFAHSPGQRRFGLTVVLILALGIGINVATLGLLYRYYVSPLPWPSGGRIVSVYFTASQPTPRAMSIPTWQRLKKRRARARGLRRKRPATRQPPINQ